MEGMQDLPPEPRVIAVDIPGHEYSIHVHPGLLQQVGNVMRRITRTRKVALVTDSTVGELHGPGVSETLRSAGFEVVPATVEPGEEHKTIRDVEKIYDQLLEAGIERTMPLIALGGGIIGDMAGFVAATLLRGIPFIQIPTTLLAMVDASIGGKTGVNHAKGKNLIGAFYQPKTVLIDPTVLSTLPLEELRGGLAECIKHEIIRDADGFHSLEENIGKALALDIPYLFDLVAHNVAIKADVVETDPFETGERAHLNFGHTFGHAFETVSKHAISHGQGVALGMVAAAQLAVSLGMIDEAARGRIVALIEKAGLPTGGIKLDADEVLKTMQFDKKVTSGRLRFILPEKIGSVVIRDDVPEGLVREAIGRVSG